MTGNRQSGGASLGILSGTHKGCVDPAIYLLSYLFFGGHNECVLINPTDLKWGHPRLIQILSVPILHVSQLFRGKLPVWMDSKLLILGVDDLPPVALSPDECVSCKEILLQHRV